MFAEDYQPVDVGHPDRRLGGSTGNSRGPRRLLFGGRPSSEAKLLEMSYMRHSCKLLSCAAAQQPTSTQDLFMIRADRDHYYYVAGLRLSKATHPDRTFAEQRLPSWATGSG